MKISLLLTTVLLSLTALAESMSPLEEQARSKVDEFSIQLKQALKSAIVQGGFTHGVKVCKHLAPAIATRMSTDGWKIGRTALKVRNTDNTADAWEAQTLEKWQALALQGPELAKVIEIKQSETQFRYMQAIPMGKLCAHCHGVVIDPKLQAEINKAYPSDQAVNFKLGQLRGAFTLTYDKNGN